MGSKFSKAIGPLGLGIGALLITAGFLITPSFVARYLPMLTGQYVNFLRASLVCMGIFALLFGASKVIHPLRKIGHKFNQHAYLILLLTLLAMATILLLTKPPFLFYSPDISYHSSKILRAMHGEYFLDPFSGTQTIYHPLFHVVFGSLNRVLQFNAFEMMQLIGLVNFLGLFLGFFLLAKVVLKDNKLAYVGTLSLALIFYAPTGRYILLQNPSNFSLIFLLPSLACLYSYAENRKVRQLALGSILGGIAVNIWWYNILPLGAFALGLAFYFIRSKQFSKEILLAPVLFMIPFLFTIWHLYSIQDVLPDYGEKAEPIRAMDLNFMRAWLDTFFLKGNQQFASKLTPLSLNSLHFYLLIMPFNLALLAGSAISYFKVRAKGNGNTTLARVLFISAVLLILLSIPIFLFCKGAHVRRVQFIAYILLLIFAYKMYVVFMPRNLVRWILPVVATMSAIALLVTVSHTAKPFTSQIPQETREVVNFIESIPSHEDTRMFALGGSLRRLTPFVEFRSFVGPRHGTYYSQDPVSSERLYNQYSSIKEKRQDWYDALIASETRYLIFRISADESESELANFYRDEGEVVLANSEWTIIEIPAK